MQVADKEDFISQDELKTVKTMLKGYKLDPDNFSIEVTEDQDEMSMEDLEYVVMLYIRVTYTPSGKMQTYICAQNSGLWIKEFAEDLKKGEFT